MRVRRRDVLTGALVLAAAGYVTPAAAGAPTADPAAPVPPFADRVAALERQYDARIGCYAVDLGTGRIAAAGADRMFAVCSTFKGYASAAVLQRARRGQLSLTAPVLIEAAAIKPNSPVTEQRVGTTMTLAELCQAALQRSDNTAGNELLRALGGPQAVTDFARSIGDGQTRLDRWEIELNSALPGDPRDTSTPQALGNGYRAILTGDVLDPADREQLRQWMLANQTSSMRAGLPPDWTTADKTGSGDFASTNDIGVAYAPDGRQLLLAFMTRTATDDPQTPALRPLIAELASATVAELAHRQ
jgi:beta-lactamase class A